jgi:hypothetical protein
VSVHTLSVLRTLFLPLLLGGAIMLVVVVTYWGLDALLANHSDYSRGLWEGAALVLVINGGNTLANRVLKRVDAKKKEKLS